MTVGGPRPGLDFGAIGRAAGSRHMGARSSRHGSSDAPLAATEALDPGTGRPGLAQFLEKWDALLCPPAMVPA